MVGIAARRARRDVVAVGVEAAADECVVSLAPGGRPNTFKLALRIFQLSTYAQIYQI